jgi:hypothetical protein
MEAYLMENIKELAINYSQLCREKKEGLQGKK